jgi:hypothetical protein
MPHTFRRHVASLGIIPAHFLSSAVTLSAALEVGWGIALIVNLAPRVVLPASVILLAALSTVSWLGVKTGKAADCGCYGGFIQPTIGQSLALNGLYAALLIGSWLVLGNDASNATWQYPIVAIGALAAAVVAEWARRHEESRGSPLFVASPIKVDARWQDRWARGATRHVKGEMLVALLGPDCPYCKQWIRIGNATIQSPDLPEVIGIVGASSRKRDEFVRDYGIRFPVVAISPSLMSRLARAVPTTLRIEEGIIKDVWVGNMPPEFVERFRRAFFPDVLLEATHAK